jgi:hypothetical protein
MTVNKNERQTMKTIQNYWSVVETAKREEARKAASDRRPGEADEEWQVRVRREDAAERREDAAHRD